MHEQIPRANFKCLHTCNRVEKIRSVEKWIKEAEKKRGRDECKENQL